MYCYACNKDKEESAFIKRRGTGLAKLCQPCRTKREQNQGRHASYLKTRYGISKFDYTLLHQEQEGRCAICKSPETDVSSLCVDHDHTTGQVRGLLCRLCNTGLGAFKDNPEALQEAIRYLEWASCRRCS